MTDYTKVGEHIVQEFKGITPKYVECSSIIVLNQKCIRNHEIDYSLSQYNDDKRDIQSSKFLKIGDILVNSTGTGTAGRCAYVSYIPKDKRVIVDSHMLVLRCASNDIAACISYQLYSVEDLLMSFMTGSSGQSEFDKVRLFDLRLRLPSNPKYLQNNLKLMFCIDKKIQANIEINNKLEQLANLIYDYWFTQFDFPDKNGKPYRSNGGKMIWNEEVKREIPERWDVISLKSLISKSKNGDWGKDIINEKSTKCFCIRGADINGLNGLESFKPPIRNIDKSHTDRHLKANDLIIEISGGSPTQSTGRMAHISQNVLTRMVYNVVCSNFCKAISLNKESLSYIVSRYWNRLYNSGVFFNYEGKTSGIKNLLFDQLVEDIKIVIPADEKLINDYFKFETVIDIQKQNNLMQNGELTKLRDWLLPILMNGQIRVA